MNFQLTEEQQMIRDTARKFAQEVLKKEVIERDRDMRHPTEETKQMGELGFLGMMTSEQYGGGDMDTISYVLVMEELSKIDASAAVIVSVCNSLVNWGLEKYGTEAQKQKYLVPLAKGEKIGGTDKGQKFLGDYVASTGPAAKAIKPLRLLTSGEGNEAQKKKAMDELAGMSGNAKNGEVVVEANEKITARKAKQLEEEGLKEILLQDEQLAGQYLASDVIDEKSGLVLFEEGVVGAA